MSEKRESFLRKAEQLASLIFEKMYELRSKPMKDVGLGSLLSIIKLKADVDEGKGMEESLSSLAPKIYEVILFGSVAAGKKEPSDIDLIVLDNGHFSNFFPCMTAEHHTEDAYEDLEDNLLWLMDGWFSVSELQLQEILRDTTVDLHVLPLKLLRSPELRREIAEKHQDPNFLKNAFGTALRFDRFNRSFKPLTIEYLEKQYHCRLDDFR